MTLGVVIPVYNGEKYIEQAVSSVLGQPCKDVEIVLIDDGSTDGSLAICEGMAQNDDRITILHQKNRGVSAARNAGINFMRGRVTYLAFLDADDCWVEKAYHEDVRKTLLESEVDILGFSSYFASEDLEWYRVAHQYEAKRICGGIESVWSYGGTFAAHFYRAALLDEHEIRFSIGLRGNEDAIFIFQCLLCARHIQYTAPFLYIYRRNTDSVTHVEKVKSGSAGHIASGWDNTAQWVRQHVQALKEQGPPGILMCERVAGARLLEDARRLCEGGVSGKKMRTEIGGHPCHRYMVVLRAEDLAPWQRGDLDLYRSRPRLFAIKYRIHGSMIRMMRVCLRFPVLERIWERKRFPLGKEQIFCE